MYLTKKLRRGHLISFLIFVLVFSVSFGAAGPKNGLGQLKKQIDGYFTQLSSEHALNGTVLVAHDGRIILEKGYGMADFENGIANKKKTVFAIASMSKAFTAMCIMMLEERGLLSVHDTVGKYIPEFPHGQLTIHQLLNHTSGLYLYVDDADSGLWRDENYARFHTPEEVMEYFMYEPLNFEPGTQWEYCNSGYVLLGIIIERVSGMTFRDFLQANICGPLKMRYTSYDPYEVDFQDRIAVPYADITVNPPVPAMYISPTIAYAVGGVFSKVRDLYKWDQALYTDRLLSTGAMERMFTPGPGEYGYGWWIQNFTHNGEARKYIWHVGAYVGYHSAFLRFVDDRITVIILDNTDTFDQPIFTFDLKLMGEHVARIIMDNE